LFDDLGKRAGANAGSVASADVVGVASSVSRLGTMRTIDPMFHTLDAASFTSGAVIRTRHDVVCAHDDVFFRRDPAS
jgi:hypothetical protein